MLSALLSLLVSVTSAWPLHVERCDGTPTRDEELDELLHLELPARETELTVRVCADGLWELRHGSKTRQFDLGSVEPRLRRRAFALLVSDVMRTSRAASLTSLPAEPSAPPVGVPASEPLAPVNAEVRQPDEAKTTGRDWQLHVSSRTFFDQPITLAVGADARVNVWWRLWVELRLGASLADESALGAFFAVLSAQLRVFEVPIGRYSLTLDAGPEGGILNTSVRTAIGFRSSLSAFTFGASARLGLSEQLRSGGRLHFTLGAGAMRGSRVLVDERPRLAPHGVFVDLGLGVMF